MLERREAQLMAVDVQLFGRNPAGSWPAEPVAYGKGATIAITSIGLELAVSEVYRGTHLA